MTTRDNNINDYLRRPYGRLLVPDAETGTYTAEVMEFPGCVSQGDTPAEAYERLEDAAKSWLEAAADMGTPIPDPLAELDYSGRIALRLPRGLHKRAAECAQIEGTSLNQFLVAATAERVGATRMYSAMVQKFHDICIATQGQWRVTVKTTLQAAFMNPTFVIQGPFETTPAKMGAVTLQIVPQGLESEAQ